MVEFLCGVEGVGAKTDEPVAGIDNDVVGFELIDNFCVVGGGEESEGSELTWVFGLEDGDVVVGEDGAEFGLLGEVCCAESGDFELFEVIESGESLVGFDDGWG